MLPNEGLENLVVVPNTLETGGNTPSRLSGRHSIGVLSGGASIIRHVDMLGEVAKSTPCEVAACTGDLAVGAIESVTIGHDERLKRSRDAGRLARG